MSAAVPPQEFPDLGDVFLAAARAYIARDWAVMPLHTPDPEEEGFCSCGKKCASPAKHPTCPHGIYDASKKTSYIESWAAAKPHANIGIRTGAISNLVVLDLDAKHGGMDTIKDLEATHGPLPVTLTALTPSGGKHLAFQHPGFVVGNNAGIIGPGVDIRGDNGYIAAAPSMGVSGKQYRWVDESVVPAVLPEAWVALLPRPRERTLALVAPTTMTEDDIIYWVNKKAGEAAVGSRNTKAFELACQLRDAGCSQTDAEIAMDDYVRAVPGGDYTLDEALKSTASAYSQAPREKAKSLTASDAPALRLIKPRKRAMDEAGAASEADDDQWVIAPTTLPISADNPVPFVALDTLKACLDEDEYGDAQLMYRLFDGRAVWDFSRKTWFLWAGHAWEEDRTNQMVHLIGGTLAAVYLRGIAEVEKKLGILAAAKDKDEDAITKLKELIGLFLKRATALRARKRLSNVFFLTQSFLGITGDEWDAKADVLAVLNGVVELETGTLRSGKPDEYLMTVVPTTWKGLDCPAPRWELFLEEMFAGRPEMPWFLQRLVGVSIRGDFVERQLPILYGEGGSNGKDKFFDALGFAFGKEIACSVGTGVLLGGAPRRGAASPDIMDLRGKRLCWASETDEDARLNEAQVKLLTGGGDVSARQLYGKVVTFAPSHMLWLMTNSLPHVSARDEALWDRLLCLECKEQFLEQPDLTNPHQHARDTALPQKLHAEASGIVAWSVRGHMEWRALGLAAPAEVRKATKEYREDQDELTLFVAESCETGENFTTAAVSLYKAYSEWAGKRAMSMRSFGILAGEKYAFKKGHAGKYYIGLKVSEVSFTLKKRLVMEGSDN